MAPAAHPPGLPSPSGVFKAWPGPSLWMMRSHFGFTTGLQWENPQEEFGLWTESGRVAVAFSYIQKGRHYRGWGGGGRDWLSGDP